MNKKMKSLQGRQNRHLLCDAEVLYGTIFPALKRWAIFRGKRDGVVAQISKSA
jgi:hypothetical protein